MTTLLMRTLFVYRVLTPLLLLIFGQPVLAQPAVSVSIKPLQLIAAAVTDGVTAPALVLDSSQDPHHPALRPSQRRAMAEADIFIWVGPMLETGMEQLTQELDARILQASILDGVTLLGAGLDSDPHLWLDSSNVLVIASALAGELIRLDPGNRQQYQNNLSEFRQQLQQAHAEIQQRFGPGSRPVFAVYHDGYRYFENQFGLAHTASFTRNEEVAPGIRQMLEIRNALDASSTSCIVAGPSVNTDKLDNLLGSTTMKYSVVDVLAHDIEADAQGYIRFLRHIADAFAACSTR